jgi:uncharacterized protein YcbK (DUF882 family)
MLNPLGHPIPSSRRVGALTLAAFMVLAPPASQALSERMAADCVLEASGAAPRPAPMSPASASSDPTPRQERAETVRVRTHLQILGTSETATIDLPIDGHLDPAEAHELAHKLRCRRTHRENAIDPGVLALLADVAVQWPEQVIEIVSGFRAPPFGAPHSKHFKGHAIDLRVRGVKTAKLRDYLWRTHRGLGVGFYSRENFVHMDSRPGEPDQAWSALEEGGAQEHNPRWAVKARRSPPSTAHSMGPMSLRRSSSPVTQGEEAGAELRSQPI